MELMRKVMRFEGLLLLGTEERVVFEGIGIFGVLVIFGDEVPPWVFEDRQLELRAFGDGLWG
jgi:hypothetical protein